MNQSNEFINHRKELLTSVAETYFNSLRTSSFSTIPFSEDVVLRAPLAPGGVHSPIKGKQAVFEKWWQPLEPALGGVSINIIDHYYNESLTGIITNAEITLSATGITLRVADRFLINDEGNITEQENHFDASPLRG